MRFPWDSHTEWFIKIPQVTNGADKAFLRSPWSGGSPMQTSVASLLCVCSIPTGTWQCPRWPRWARWGQQSMANAICRRHLENSFQIHKNALGNCETEWPRQCVQCSLNQVWRWQMRRVHFAKLSMMREIDRQFPQASHKKRKESFNLAEYMWKEPSGFFALTILNCCCNGPLIGNNCINLCRFSGSVACWHQKCVSLSVFVSVSCIL